MVHIIPMPRRFLILSAFFARGFGLTTFTDKIGEWSENPFEGLHNDVPISTIARGIERDIRQIAGETELPPARQVKNSIMF